MTESDLQLILDTIPTYIWFKDDQHRILKTNRAAAEATGLDADQIEGRLTQDVYPHQAEAYLAGDCELLQHDADVRDRLEVLESVDGRKRLMRVDKYKIRPDESGPFGVLVVGTDVTEVHAAQQALRRSEAKFRSLFDNSPVGMILFDRQGRIQLCNRRAGIIFGHDDRSLGEQPIGRLIPAIGKILADGETSGSDSPSPERPMDPIEFHQHETRGCRADDTKLVVELTTCEVTIDDEAMTLANVIDVTQRSETAMQLKLAVDVGNVGFWEVDLKEQSVNVSSQLLRQIGLKTPWSTVKDWRDQLHPDDVESAIATFDDYVAGRTDHYESVFRLRHGQGGYRWILSRGTRAPEEDGTTRRIVGFHIDISDQHQTRLELQRSNHDLDRFAYIASHDLKAPLRGIQNIASWIEEDLGEAVDTEVRDHLNLLKRQAQRMHLLLDDLLAYARVGRRTEDWEDVDLNRMIEELFRFMSPPESLQLQIECELEAVRTPRAPLEQVLRNLIGNAIQHGGEDNPKLVVRCMKEASMLRFRVQDFGPGIEPDHHERVFELFQSLRGNQTEGTGMGLALVRRLVEHAGGRVWLESEPGHGATFHFTWPCE